MSETSKEIFRQLGLYSHVGMSFVLSVGSGGNRTATETLARILDSFNFAVECPEFDCIDWTQGGVHLTAGGESFEAFASPYSLGCQVRAPLEIVNTLEELETAKAGDSVLLVRGELTREQLEELPLLQPGRAPADRTAAGDQKAAGDYCCYFSQS